MKKLLIPSVFALGLLGLAYLITGAKNSEKQKKITGSQSNQDVNTDNNQSDSSRNTYEKGGTGGGSSEKNPNTVDTSQIYGYWPERGENIYLKKGGKTAEGTYAVGFLIDGRVVYTQYLNEGTPEESVVYSLSPEYVLVY